MLKVMSLICKKSKNKNKNSDKNDYLSKFEISNMHILEF